ncbi:hypothetical protein CV093_10185 [Oceanobacillus sp. 143]|nr:hypothetical protein CV093_10185 [Oceanobacillus sp. 143]
MFTFYRDEFVVSVEHLPISSNKYVKVLCDYCLNKGLTTIKEEPYQTYIRNKKGIIKKDCCNDCKPLKVKESNLLVYGKESTNQVDQIREKQKKTNLIRYGGENVMASSKIRQKVKHTNLQRYGTKAPAQNEKVKIKWLRRI